MRSDFYWTTITPAPVAGPHPELWVIAPPNDLPGMPVAYDGDLRLNRRIGYPARHCTDAAGRDDRGGAGGGDDALRALAREHPSSDEGRVATLVSAKQQQLGHVRLPVMMLLAAAALLLLGACLNIANLQLMRLAVRRRDLAVQATLGASAGRIVRQIGSEVLTLAAAGRIAGVATALRAD